MLKKSYKGFGIWMLVFTLGMVGLAFLPFEAHLMTRIVMNACTMGVAALTLIIYLTEYIYWYNGTTYEAALEAGPVRRKVFALRHLKLFGGFAVLYLVVSVILQITGVSIAWDIAIVTVGLVVVAFMSVPIKL